jgi:hypothetical protein
VQPLPFRRQLPVVASRYSDLRHVGQRPAAHRTHLLSGKKAGASHCHEV